MSKPKTGKTVLEYTAFLAQHGSYYKWISKTGALFTETEDAKKFKKSFYKRPKGCYYNAQRMAFENKELKYYEGWAVSGKIGIPLEHGFNVFDGKVVDISWSDGVEYFGVEIPVKFALKKMVETEFAGTLLYSYFSEEKEKTKTD